MENPGSLLQVSQAGPFRTQLMPWLSRLQKTLLSVVITLFPDSPGCLSHSAFEPLHCCSLTWKTNSPPPPTSFHIFILFVSALTEAWTTQFKVTAPKSHCPCCYHFLHDPSFYSSLVYFIYGHFLPRCQLQHSLCLSLSLLCPRCLEQCLTHSSCSVNVGEMNETVSWT